MFTYTRTENYIKIKTSININRLVKAKGITEGMAWAIGCLYLAKVPPSHERSTTSRKKESIKSIMVVCVTVGSCFGDVKCWRRLSLWSAACRYSAHSILQPKTCKPCSSKFSLLIGLNTYNQASSIHLTISITDCLPCSRGSDLHIDRYQ